MNKNALTAIFLVLSYCRMATFLQNIDAMDQKEEGSHLIKITDTEAMNSTAYEQLSPKAPQELKGALESERTRDFPIPMNDDVVSGANNIFASIFSGNVESTTSQSAPIADQTAEMIISIPKLDQTAISEDISKQPLKESAESSSDSEGESCDYNDDDDDVLPTSRIRKQSRQQSVATLSQSSDSTRGRSPVSSANKKTRLTEDSPSLSRKCEKEEERLPLPSTSSVTSETSGEIQATVLSSSTISAPFATVSAQENKALSTTTDTSTSSAITSEQLQPQSSSSTQISSTTTDVPTSSAVTSQQSDIPTSSSTQLSLPSSFEQAFQLTSSAAIFPQTSEEPKQEIKLWDECGSKSYEIGMCLRDLVYFNNNLEEHIQLYNSQQGLTLQKALADREELLRMLSFKVNIYSDLVQEYGHSLTSKVFPSWLTDYVPLKKENGDNTALLEEVCVKNLSLVQLQILAVACEHKQLALRINRERILKNELSYHLEHLNTTEKSLIKINRFADISKAVTAKMMEIIDFIETICPGTKSEIFSDKRTYTDNHLRLSIHFIRLIRQDIVENKWVNDMPLIYEFLKLLKPEILPLYNTSAVSTVSSLISQSSPSPTGSTSTNASESSTAVSQAAPLQEKPITASSASSGIPTFYPKQLLSAPSGVPTVGGMPTYPAQQWPMPPTVPSNAVAAYPQQFLGAPSGVPTVGGMPTYPAQQWPMPPTAPSNAAAAYPQQPLVAPSGIPSVYTGNAPAYPPLQMPTTSLAPQNPMAAYSQQPSVTPLKAPMTNIGPQPSQQMPMFSGSSADSTIVHSQQLSAPSSAVSRTNSRNGTPTESTATAPVGDSSPSTDKVTADQKKEIKKIFVETSC